MRYAGLILLLAAGFCAGCIHLRPAVEQYRTGPGLQMPAGESMACIQWVRQDGETAMLTEVPEPLERARKGLQSYPDPLLWSEPACNLALRIADAGFFKKVVPLPRQANVVVRVWCRAKIVMPWWGIVQVADLFAHTLVFPIMPLYHRVEYHVKLYSPDEEVLRAYKVRRLDRCLTTCWGAAYLLAPAAIHTRGLSRALEECIQLMKRDLSREKTE
jgi:hypothetical protein